LIDLFANLVTWDVPNYTKFSTNSFLLFPYNLLFYKETF
jgi:hypothetical protein